MNEPKISKPAFPTVARDGNWQPHNDGMSLRDYFAGQVLAGWTETYHRLTGANGWYGAETVAETCYRIADAMLKERARVASNAQAETQRPDPPVKETR